SLLTMLSSCITRCIYRINLNYEVSSTYFFLHICRTPRALHSFPTRRSSDLIACARAVSTWPMASHQPAITNQMTLPMAPTATSSDRKSTRLNSSHVSISYAVFCLKKKMYIHSGQVQLTDMKEQEKKYVSSLT